MRGEMRAMGEEMREMCHRGDRGNRGVSRGVVGDGGGARAIYAQIPGAEDASSVIGEGFFVIPCNDIPTDVTFTIAGKAVTLSADSLNFGELEEGSKACVGGTMGTN